MNKRQSLVSLSNPKTNIKKKKLLKVYSYLENKEDEQLAIFHLHDERSKILDTAYSQPFGRSYIKQKLSEQYDKNIYFAEEEDAYCPLFPCYTRLTFQTDKVRHTMCSL